MRDNHEEINYSSQLEFVLEKECPVQFLPLLPTLGLVTD